MTFSKRYKYDQKFNYDQIFEDAPQWLRLEYCNEVLFKLTYIDMDPRYKYEYGSAPLGVKGLHEKFCSRIKEETQQSYYDSWFAHEELKSHLLHCEWYQFYDFVELAGEELQLFDKKNTTSKYQIYKVEVNKLFSDNKVVWQINDESKLQRKIPKILSAQQNKAAEKLNQYKPAKEHFKKAKRYLFEYPIDQENSIKEIISAVESIGRSIFLKTATLGEVIKELRKQSIMPKILIDMIEKLYIYGCAEPGIRHGSPQESNLRIFDAELCFHVGTAFIIYLDNISELYKKQL